MDPTRKKIEMLAWLGAFFTLCGAVVWVRTSTVKATYQYVQQERRLSQLGQEIRDFRIRWLKLTAPKRLESLAQKFELAPANANQRVLQTPKEKLH
jgi:hypothetical protein